MFLSTALALNHPLGLGIGVPMIHRALAFDHRSGARRRARAFPIT